MNKRVLAVLIAVLAGIGVLVQPASARTAIIGGSNADQPYPFAVALLRTSGKMFCAGSLVAPTWVVTAAHCVSGKNPAVLGARVGSNDSTTGGELAQPAEFVVHPDFNPAGAGADIALVRLDKPVTAAPIGLGAAATPGTAVRVLGWGQTCPVLSCAPPPAILQQLDTQIVDPAGCTAAFNPDVELCTGNPGGTAGSCYGDSGGPEIAKVEQQWVLVGETSRPGNGDATCATAPSIYTSVVAYAQWINTTITPPPVPQPPAPAPARAR